MTARALGRTPPKARRRALALFKVLAAQCMFAMDLLIVVMALPRMQQDLGFTSANLSWVLNAFGLAFGGLLLLGGRLGDMVGQVRAFRAGPLVFVLASLLDGLAETPAVLVRARMLQGMGAALAGPSVLALVMVMARDATAQARGMSLHRRFFRWRLSRADPWRGADRVHDLALVTTRQRARRHPGRSGRRTVGRRDPSEASAPGPRRRHHRDAGVGRAGVWLHQRGRHG